MAIKTLFVTCGATVPFPELVDLIVSAETFERLQKLGFGRVIVQFGRGYGNQFKQQANGLGKAATNCSLDAQALGCESGCFFCVRALDTVELIGIEYSTKVQEIVSTADLVVSHAGTGSILDSLRLNKPLIVCVNDRLMDNHQQQIADKFEEKGYVWACRPRSQEFYACLRRSAIETLNPFPQAHNAQFENLLVNSAFP